MLAKSVLTFILICLSMPVLSLPVGAGPLDLKEMGGPKSKLLASTGGKIIFTSNRTGNDDIFMMNPDGSNQINLTNDPKHDSGAAWSPDGRKIVFVRYDGSATFDIYTMNIDGSNQVKLTNVPVGQSSFWPSWSPDGTRIVFTRLNQIYQMNADGTNQVQLSFHPGADDAPKYSPDGTRILYYCFRGDNSEICIMDANGSNEIKLTTDIRADLFPMFSPDGSKITFSRNSIDITENFDDDIWIMKSDGSDPVDITNIYNIHSSQGSWSPDGTKIVFQTNQDGGNNYNIYVINVDGTNRTRLTTNPTHDTEPMWKLLAPSTMGGRVTDASGNGISNARITMTDSSSAERFATTTPFGYYHFANVEVAETYTFTVAAKRYRFSQPSLVRSNIGDIYDINFVANN